MKKQLIGLYGAGGFGREVMSLLESNFTHIVPNQSKDQVKICFIDDDTSLSQVQGIDVISLIEFLKLDIKEKFFNITIANPIIRKQLSTKFSDTDVKPLSMIFSDSLILKESTYGVGTIIMPKTIISANVKIGNFSHVNFNSYIAHDCVLENFVTISPSVTCCGNVHIRECSYIGAGSIIKQGTHNAPRYIGNNSTLGMGSNLLIDLPDNQTFVGNPAKSI